jgi:hypothetical protein
MFLVIGTPANFVVTVPRTELEKKVVRRVDAAIARVMVISWF